jgi:hypothetical protein
MGWGVARPLSSYLCCEWREKALQHPFFPLFYMFFSWFLLVLFLPFWQKVFWIWDDGSFGFGNLFLSCTKSLRGLSQLLRVHNFVGKFVANN